uniref:hypothetical protein n=1 Tax=Candidatus Limisoma sp. TaxID=3076476 RepID=UPI00402772D7
ESNPIILFSEQSYYNIYYFRHAMSRRCGNDNDVDSMRQRQPTRAAAPRQWLRQQQQLSKADNFS